MVIIKNYKVKKLFNKFPEISRKIGINFRKFFGGNFRTHIPSCSYFKIEYLALTPPWIS